MTAHRRLPRADMLRLPLIGPALRSKRGRLWLQMPLVLVALLFVYDGLTGPQTAGQNLATVGVWVHYRGLIVLALLLAGNLFCMACPFTLPRSLARRWAIRGPRFPRALRNKWIAVGGLFLIFYLYEALDLWASPALTAWLIVAYFAASFVLELVFSESAFCKYVCPLGAFNFVYSSLSPLHVMARDSDVCRTCVGKECVNGSYAETPIILIDQIGENGAPSRTHTHDSAGVLGCGTLLFVPQMTSNLDCTLCLDCARACPHDNVALALRSPAREVTSADSYPARWDTAFLFVALTFMGLSNAFGMIPAVYETLNALATVTGIRAEWATLLILFGVGNLLLPAGLSLGTAWLARRMGRRNVPLRAVYAAFAPAFIPLGMGIWAAHYAFHFILGALSIVPVFQNFLVDHRIPLLGAPDWALGNLMQADQIAGIQALFLMVGYLGSMVVARQAASRLFGKRGPLAWLPYALLLLGLMAAALAVFGQPMEMRGTIGFEPGLH